MNEILVVLVLLAVLYVGYLLYQKRQARKLIKDRTKSRDTKPLDPTEPPIT